MNTNTLKIPENLDISEINIPDIPEDILFPDELNRYLRDQIRYYVHENGMLQKNLSDLESYYNQCKIKMSELDMKLRNYEKMCNKNEFMTSGQVASTKIVELSKKLREKNAEVESLKTKYSKLEYHLFQMKKEENTIENVAVVEEKTVNETAEQLKTLQDKLNSTTNKLSETRNINFQLKNELKLANKYLQQELGESFSSMLSLTSNNASWRGRAQIICDLQQKNNELKEKLKSLQEKCSNGSTETNIVLSKVESKVRILSKENLDLKTKYEDLKKKNESLKARCRVLDSDSILLKSKINMIKEQSEKDQKQISTLLSQLASYKDLKNDILLQKDNTITKLQNEKKLLHSEIEQYKNTINSLKEEFSKNNVVSENQECQEIQLNKKLETKKGKSDAEEHFIKIIEDQNNRLIAERDAHTKTQSLLRLEKQKVIKAEAAAARAELESGTSRSGYYSSITSSRLMDNTLKDQLELAEENIKAMKTRLEIEQFERKKDLEQFMKIVDHIQNLKDNKE